MDNIANAATSHAEEGSSTERSTVPPSERTKVVVVGLGMVRAFPLELYPAVLLWIPGEARVHFSMLIVIKVGMGFIEKLLERDSVQKQYSIIVLGEEKHVAYNRVGLTSFFGKSRIQFVLSRGI